MTAVEWVATSSTLLSLVAFAGYVVSLIRSPSSGRPRTPVYDRFGQEMPPDENPGYKETEHEHH